MMYTSVVFSLFVGLKVNDSVGLANIDQSAQQIPTRYETAEKAYVAKISCDFLWMCNATFRVS
jgi:acetoacetate decarboxylase